MSIVSRIGARAALLLSALTLTQAAWAPPALADDRSCARLRADLASASMLGNSAEFRKYSQAVATQREQLGMALRHAQNVRCGPHAQASRPECAPIDAKIAKMENNLASLEDRLAEMERADNRRPIRTRILAALAANRCDDAREAAAPLEADRPGRAQNGRSGGSVEVLAPARPPVAREAATYERPGPRQEAEIARPARNVTIIAGNPPVQENLARPMAHERPAALQEDPVLPDSGGLQSPPDAGVDEQAEEIAAFPPPSDTDEPATIEGDAPEAGLPAETELPTVPGEAETPSPSLVRPEVPAQTSAVQPLETELEETAGSGSVMTGAVEALPPGPPPMAEAVPHHPGDRKVRVVGPTFLPDPEAAIDLRAPVRRQAR